LSGFMKIASLPSVASVRYIWLLILRLTDHCRRGLRHGSWPLRVWDCGCLSLLFLCCVVLCKWRSWDASVTNPVIKIKQSSPTKRHEDAWRKRRCSS
jgi:hypothetical protein